MRSRGRIATLVLSLATILGSTYLAAADKDKSSRRQEEDAIRTAYAKMSYADEVHIILDTFLRTGRNQLWKSKANLVDPALESRLSFILSEFNFGKTSSIADRKMADFDGSPTWIGGEVLDASPGVFNYSTGDKSPSKYVAYVKFAWKPSPYHALSPAESWPIAKALQSEQFAGQKYTDYVSYTVTATLAGKSRTYKAWALFRKDEKGMPDFYFMDAVANPTAVTFGWQHSLYPAAFAESDLRSVPFIDKWLYDNARSCAAPHSEKDDNRADVCCDPQTGRCGVAKSSLPPYSSRRPAPARRNAQLVPASFHISELPLYALPQSSSASCSDFNTLNSFTHDRRDFQEHKTGWHGFVGEIVGSCTYTDIVPGVPGPCNVFCQAETEATGGETSDSSYTGAVFFHATAHAETGGASSDPDSSGTVRCQGTAGFTVKSCLIPCSTDISIDARGSGIGAVIKFPQTQVWSDQFAFPVGCPARATAAPPPPSGGGGGGSCPLGDPTCGDCPPDDPNCVPIVIQESPIIIDTEGEGFHLTSAPDGVKFDMSGTGKPIQLSWTDPHFHNAFLALPGANGVVDSGKELFGNFTPQPKSAHPNGFIALAEFDKRENGGNGDGIINEKDQVFSNLRLWIDENHDGICQPEELHRLPELGVYSLELKYTESRKTDQFGNQFRYRGRINPGERKDPRDHTDSGEPGRWIYDVFFVTK